MHGGSTHVWCVWSLTGPVSSNHWVMEDQLLSLQPTTGTDFSLGCTTETWWISFLPRQLTGLRPVLSVLPQGQSRERSYFPLLLLRLNDAHCQPVSKETAELFTSAEQFGVQEHCWCEPRHQLCFLNITAKQRNDLQVETDLLMLIASFCFHARHEMTCWS